MFAVLNVLQKHQNPPDAWRWAVIQTDRSVH